MKEKLNTYILNPKNKDDIHLISHIMISCLLFVVGITLFISIGLSFYFFIEQSTNLLIGLFHVLLIAVFFTSGVAIVLSVMHVFQKNIFEKKYQSYLEHFTKLFSNDKKFAAYFIFSVFSLNIKNIIQKRSFSLLKPTEYILFKFKNTPLQKIIDINEQHNFDNFYPFLTKFCIKLESYKNRDDFLTLLKLKNKNKLSSVGQLGLCDCIEKYKKIHLSTNIDQF